jgi:thioredoxin 1
MFKATSGWGATALGVLALAMGVLVSSGCAPGEPAVPATGADDAVQQALRAGKPTVVEFGADNCSSCKAMKPVLAQLARAHGDRMGVLDINLLRHGDYISRYKIMLMPTQVFFDAQGRETGRHMGKISAEEMLARLEGRAR